LTFKLQVGVYFVAVPLINRLTEKRRISGFSPLRVLGPSIGTENCADLAFPGLFSHLNVGNRLVVFPPAGEQERFLKQRGVELACADTPVVAKGPELVDQFVLVHDLKGSHEGRTVLLAEIPSLLALFLLLRQLRLVIPLLLLDFIIDDLQDGLGFLDPVPEILDLLDCAFEFEREGFLFGLAFGTESALCDEGLAADSFIHNINRPTATSLTDLVSVTKSKVVTADLCRSLSIGRCSAVCGYC
jgi:hypothetical protein